MHAIYWLVTHRANKIWMEGTKIGAAGERFFGPADAGETPSWRRLRNRWEVSHVARATLSLAALTLLLIALALR
jgi:hypothetical protein